MSLVLKEHKPVKIYANYVECACGWSSGIDKLENLNEKYVRHLPGDGLE